MNKVLPTLATVFALGAGGAGLYLVQKPGSLLAGEAFAPAEYLPADTLVLLALPDPAKTAEHWRTTDLYQIWTEPEVQAFATKPLSKLPPQPRADTIRAQIAELDPKSLFVALTKVDEGNNHPHLLGGFRFKGPKEKLETLLIDLKNHVRDHQAGKADLIQYQGHAVETFVGSEGSELAAVYLGDWYLLANDTALLKATIDRVDHRTPADTSLGKDADYLAVGAKLPSDRETLIFARPRLFFERLYAFAAASGKPVNPEAREEAEKIRALGATTGIENGKIRDTIYSYAPGLKQDYAHLRLSSLPLSSPETLFFLANVIQWQKMAVPDNASPAAPGAAPLQQYLSNLEAHDITLGAIQAAFGSEGGLQLTWPAASLQPSVLASLEVRDAAAAQKLVAQWVTLPLGDGTWAPRQDGGQTYYALDSATLGGKLQPTLTLTGKHLILGLDAPEVRAAVQREAGGGENFTASAAYKTAAAQVDKANVSFAYLDTKGLFERAYGLLRPYALMGAAFLPAQDLEYFDPSKLPETETIAKHLSPSVLSQTLDKDGSKLESIGSITFAQGGAVIGAAASAAAFTVLGKNGLDTMLPGWFPKAPGVQPTHIPDDENDAPESAETPAPSQGP